MAKLTLVAVVAGAFVLSAVACGGAATPTVPPDRPRLAVGEVIALVQESAKRVQIGSLTCYKRLRLGFGNLVATYQGNGRWLVALGDNYEWEVYENTHTVRSLKGGC